MNENKIILVASSGDSEANKSHRILGKIEIRFWDEVCKRYWDDEAVDFADIVVDRHGNAVYREIYDPELSKKITVHFYKDGERIA